MDLSQLTDQLKLAARAEGFHAVGAAPAVTPTGLHRFHEWLATGYAGEMSYLADRAEAYQHPHHVLEGARSLLMMALDYRTVEPARVGPGQGRVSRYAWGPVDYHDLIHARLKRLKRVVERLLPGVHVRGVVDTAPLLEREFAQLAGLGWQGKHTLLIRPDAGSYFFLAALLLDQELAYDTAFSADHCGECTACLDACPTQAFPQPYVLDARRCISYLTIELKSNLPDELQGSLGEWLFGCDICQEVCPWNRFATPTPESQFQPRADLAPVDLHELFAMTEEDFRAVFRRSPLWRPKRRGILRNAAFVLAQNPADGSAGVLQQGLHDPDPLVRETCAQALAQI